MELDETTIKSLTTEELMRKLESCGERTGPITPTTRSLYEKRLLKKIRLNSAAACSLVYNTDESPSSNSCDSPNTNSTDSHSKPSSTLINNFLKSESNELDENSTGPFYGVRPPPTSGAIGRIFTNRIEALKYVKQNANSRFKSFTCHADAESFCANLEAEPDVAPSTPQTPFPTKPAPGEGSPFKSVRTQELVALRKMIETGEAEKFKKMIWSNPRYLVGSGDTPTILQEGSRYNAMHICAQKNQAEICSILIDTVEDPAFLQLMYPDSKTGLDDRIDFLVDLFLNTPDKNGCESPLHFACKLGNAEVVAILAAHPRVDRELKNKYGETAAEVICARVPKATAKMKEKIQQLLDERYYVRLFRNEDQSVRITKPWSLSRNDSYQTSIDTSATNPVQFSNSPREAPMAVKAYAGPMSKIAAEELYSRWTASPQRVPAAKNHSVLRRTDPLKGYERIGRELTSQVSVPWREYWAFLGTYTDLRTEEGLKLLENHLQEKKRLIEEMEERERAESDFCDMFDSGVGEHDSDDGSDAESFVTAGDDITVLADFDDDEVPEDSYYNSSSVMDSSWSELVTSTAVFIEGDRPTRSDTDVLRALEGLNIGVNEYPLIIFWRNRILSYPETERNRWPLPRGKKNFESPTGRQRTGAERIVRSMAGEGMGFEEEEFRSVGGQRASLSPDRGSETVRRTLW